MKNKSKFFASIMLLLTLGIGQMWGDDETIFLWNYDGSTIYGDGSNNGSFDITGTTGTIKFVTYEKKKTSADGTISYNEAVTDNNLKPSVTKALKLGNNGAHLCISPASGNFKAGDIIYVSGYLPVLVTTSTDPTSTAKITTDTGEGGKTTVLSSSLTLGASKTDINVGSITLPSNFTETDKIYISRVPSTSVGIVAIKVVRPSSGGEDPEPVTYYTVTLNPAGGTISDATGWTLNGGNYEKEVASGTELTLPTFTKENRTFKTWRNAVPADVTSPITVSADVTLTAVWCATIENVIYSWEGAEGGATEVGGIAKSSTDGGSSFDDKQINVAQAGYYCIQLNGKNDYSTNIVEITLSGSEKVKTGDYIRYTGFYNNADTKNAAPKMRDEDGTAIFSGSNLPNINSASPRTDTHVVPDGINSSKVQLTRAQTQTSSFLSKLQIIRPTFVEEANLCAVTFNMHGHGDAVAQQDIVKGGKITEPATASISGWDFGGWYKESTYDNAWDFANDVVNAATELHAKWTKSETLSDDATLSDLKVGGTTIAGFNAATTEYYYEMPYGTAKADLPLITVTVNEEHATAVVQNAKDRPDDTRATIAVTAEDGTIKHYYVYFYNAPKLGVEIIKATHTGAKTASISGYIGGSADKSTQDNGKLGSNGHYFGIQLASGNFQAGDIVAIKASVLNGGNTATLYSDKGDTEIKVDGTFDATSKMYTYTLEAEAENIYLYRKSSACNPNVEYMAVYRSMSPFITSFKFGDDAATINESAKTITIDVPSSTDVTALTPTIEAYGNGGATYTPTGAQDFSSPVNYTVTDAYDELSTTYAVTVNVAAASENAYLASLSVEGYALDFNKETTTYTIVLDYGTSSLPEITYEVEDTGLATAVKVEGGVNGATTITVTPEAGAGHEKVYTINFSVSTSPKFVVFDGRTMTSAVIEREDATSGFSWTNNNASATSSNNSATINGRAYTKSVKIFGGATNNNGKNTLTFTVPADYLAKFYIAGSSNNSDAASLFISKEITPDPANAIACVTAANDDPAWAQSSLQLPGTYYFCASGSARIYELSIQLYEIDYPRELPQGMLSTTCLPNGGVVAGASIYEIAYMDFEADGTTPHKIYFDEVVGGVMEAGMPYVVLVNENSAGMYVVYTDNANKTTGLSHNGLVGYLGATKALDENDYFIYNNLFYYVSDDDALSGRIRISSNRAYIDLSAVPTEAASAPAPGRRRVALGNGNSAPMVATAIDNAQAGSLQCTKVLIDGQLFILRGEKMYDVTGRIVK